MLASSFLSHWQEKHAAKRDRLARAPAVKIAAACVVLGVIIGGVLARMWTERIPMEPHQLITMPVALTVFGVAFAAWGWVVAWGVTVVRAEVAHIRRAYEEHAKALNDHITQTERRLATLEAESRYHERQR